MPGPLEFEPLGTAREIQIHNYLHLLAVSFLFYDHIITAGDIAHLDDEFGAHDSTPGSEVDYLWRRPKTPSAYWFFFNRYFALFGNIAVTVLGFTTLQPNLMLIFNQVLVCVLLTLRIYALYGCSLRVLAYMVGSGAVLAGVSLWALFGQKSAPAEQGSGCHIGLSSETAIRLAGSWEALFVYDTILFGLTMAKTWKGRHDHGLTRISVPIINLIFRDGAIYFAVMAFANLANILTFYFCGPFLRGGLSTFASSVSVTMMSRLMLNLHETADVGIYSTATYTDTNVEYSQPTNVELDTLWSGDLEHPTHTLQSFRIDESTQMASFNARVPS